MVPLVMRVSSLKRNMNGSSLYSWCLYQLLLEGLVKSEEPGSWLWKMDKQGTKAAVLAC